jgi:hypothetical protein
VFEVGSAERLQSNACQDGGRPNVFNAARRRHLARNLMAMAK